MRIKSRFIVFVFLLLCGLLTSRLAHALNTEAWISSNTTTADSTVTLCGQFTLPLGTNTVVVPSQGVIHAVIISSAAAGTVQLYDSSWTVISATSSLTIGPIVTAAITAPMVYDVVFRHGLSYVKIGTAAIQIIYSCF